MDIQAELISIGNELLSGRTLNTHGRDLGKTLGEIGIQLVRDTTIPDKQSTIAQAVEEAFTRVDLVFVSGGLGPTVDDITRDALAAYLDRKIILDQVTADYLTKWYAERGRSITLAATRQAQVLEGSVVLRNSAGAAPGQRIERTARQTLFVLPGPPNEFNTILAEEIVPWLKERFAGARPKLVRIVKTREIGESDIVTILEDAAFNPEGIELGFYPANWKVEIRLTARPGSEAAISDAEQTLLKLLADHLDPED